MDAHAFPAPVLLCQPNRASHFVAPPGTSLRLAWQEQALSPCQCRCWLPSLQRPDFSSCPCLLSRPPLSHRFALRISRPVLTSTAYHKQFSPLTKFALLLEFQRTPLPC